MRIYHVFIVLFLSLPVMANEVPDLAALALLDDQGLMSELPADADRNRLERQRRALAKGMYWTERGTIKPLPFDKPL